MTRNIFFDLDGTLIDCKKRLYNLFTDLAPSHGLTFEDYASLKSKQVNKREIEYKKAMAGSMMLESKKFQTRDPNMRTLYQGLTEEQKKIKDQYKKFVWLLKG